MHCIACSKELPEGAAFCPFCGAKAIEPEAEEPEKKPAKSRQKTGSSRKKESRTEQLCAEAARALGLPAKSVKLMGSEITFPGNCFVEQYTNEFFSGKFTAIGQDIGQQIQSLDIDQSGIVTQICTTIICDGISRGVEELKSFAEKTGLDDGTRDEIIGQYQELIEAFGDRMEELEQLFDQIDEGVDDAIFRRECEQVYRPRVQSFGFGLKGLAKAAVTQSVLNKGIDLAYNAADKANIGFIRGRARSQKKELLENCVKIVRDFFDEGDQVVPAVCLEIVEDRFPGTVWRQDEDRIRELMISYAKVEDDKDRRRLSLELLREAPCGKEQYDRCFSLTGQEALKTQIGDAKALVAVAEWFEVDISEQKQKYAEAILERIAGVYGPEDMRRYNALLQVEKAFGSRSKTSEKMFDQYVKMRLDSIEGCLPEQAEPALEDLEAFARKYKYSVTKQVKEYRQRMKQMLQAGDVTYDTLEEAEAARKELEAIDRLYKKHGRYGVEELTSFALLMEKKLKTQSGKEEYARREKHLLEQYSEKTEAVSGVAAKGGALIIGCFVLALAATAAGVAMFLLAYGWFVRILGICIGLGGWTKFVDAVRNSGDDVASTWEEKKSVSEFKKAFDKSFVIVDGHVQKRR